MSDWLAWKGSAESSVKMMVNSSVKMGRLELRAVEVMMVIGYVGHAVT